MIDIRSETIMSLGAAAKLECLPKRRRGKRLHVATLYRWATHGIRGTRLEVLRVGGTLCTSTEALQRFFAALSESRPAHPAISGPLDAHGIEHELENHGF